MLTLWRSTTGGPFSEEVEKKANWTGSWHHFQAGREIIFQSPWKVLLIDILPTWFSNESCSNFVELFAIVVSHSLSACPHVFQLLHRDCRQINSHNPRSWKKENKNKKRTKIHNLPLPSATHLSATSLWLSSRLSSKWKHTHSYKTHICTCTHKETLAQSLVERGRC